MSMRKKLAGLVALAALLCGVASCSNDSEYSSETEHTCIVTVGELNEATGYVRPDLWDTIFYMRKSDLEAFDLKKGDRASITFTSGYSVSDGYMQGKYPLVKKVHARLPVGELKPATAVATPLTEQPPFNRFLTYGYYYMWVWRNYLTIGVEYSAASETPLTLTADKMNGDTLFVTLHTDGLQQGSNSYAQFCSFDLSAFRSFDDAALKSSLFKADSLYVMLSARYDYTYEGDTSRVARFLYGKFQNKFK